LSKTKNVVGSENTEPKLLLIEWIDSTSLSTGWGSARSVNMPHIFSFGFLQSETEDAYVLSHSMVPLRGYYYDVFAVPKGAVVNINTLTLAEMANILESKEKGSSKHE